MEHWAGLEQATPVGSESSPQAKWGPLQSMAPGAMGHAGSSVAMGHEDA